MPQRPSTSHASAARQQRVEEIKRRIREGRYEIDYDSLADRLLAVHGGSREPLEKPPSLGETPKGAPEQQKSAALAPADEGEASGDDERPQS